MDYSVIMQMLEDNTLTIDNLAYIIARTGGVTKHDVQESVREAMTYVRNSCTKFETAKTAQDLRNRAEYISMRAEQLEKLEKIKYALEWAILPD